MSEGTDATLTDASDAEVQTQTSDAAGGAGEERQSDGYDKAFDTILADGIQQEREVKAGVSTDDRTPDTGTSGGPQFSDDDEQVIRRSGLDPDTIGQLPPEAQRKFIAAQKERQQESDRISSQLRAGSTEEVDGQPGDGADDQTQSDGEREEVALSDEHEASVQTLTEEYGDEVGDLARRAYTSETQVTEMRGRLDKADKHYAGLMSSMAEEIGLMSIAAEYPSVYEDDGRKQMLDAFRDEWKRGDYSSKEGPVMMRVSEAMRVAAKLTFTETETAAQARLIDEGVQRRNGQPLPRARNRPSGRPTPGDPYGKAFDRTLAGAVRSEMGL